MSTSFQPKPTLETRQEIRELLTNTYLNQDVWDIKNDFFNLYRPEKWNGRQRNIDFSMFSSVIRNEIKYFYAIRLERHDLRLQTIASYGYTHPHLAAFLQKYYPGIQSIVNLPEEKAKNLYRMFLIKNGFIVDGRGKLKSSQYGILLSQLLEFYINYYDSRDEFEKDIWDCRKIPGARITENAADYLLNFRDIPFQYHPLVKRYIKVRINNKSQGQCKLDIMAIRLFLLFINSIHPKWTSLSDLSRSDMEAYLSWYRQYTSGLKEIHNSYIICLRMFIEYIQKAEYPEAPKKPSAQLIWKEDIPRLQKRTSNDIKFIPEGVLRQLEDNLEYISPPEYIPIVIILRASGWRVSDVLNLRYDTCLERTSQGWWLCGDIPKTEVLNHRIPITDEVAAVIKAAIEDTLSKSTNENNPKHYLFVRLDGRRIGLPPQGKSIQYALNRLAQKQNIVDDNGKVFHFGNHAFRHTKGIELINNGMSLLHVQKWMAHASPEMTLVYARILDTTMRKSWEKAVKNGVFRLDSTGKPIKVNLSELENEDQIEWEYIRSNLDAVKIPLGYCFKSKKVDCRQQLNPCLVCSSFCTVPEFLPQFEIEMMEVRQVINRATAQGQTVWVEKNQALLERYEAIVAVLKEGKIHHRTGKAGREYVGEERNNAK